MARTRLSALAARTVLTLWLQYKVHQYSGDGNFRTYPVIARIYSGSRSYQYIAGRHGRIQGRRWCVARVDARSGSVRPC